MINHERWEDNEWDYAPDAHEPMEMPEEWVYTEPNEGPEKRDPFAEIFTGENSIAGKVAKGIADALEGAPSLADWLKPVREAGKKLIRPVEDRVAQVEESQLSAAEQLAALEDRRGYIQSYQSRNYQHGGGGATIMTQWTQSGPARSASVESFGIRLETPGVWTVHFQCFGEATSSGTGFGVRDEVTAELTILISPNPSGPILRQYVKELAAQGGTGKVSLSVSFPVVVPEGHDVVIVPRVYSARRRRFLGGERYSALSAVKRDVETGPQGEETVPDA